MIENPTQFQRAEVGSQGQTSCRAEAVLTTLPSEFCDVSRDAHILPDNRIVNRFTGFPVPNKGGFALIGDANGGQITRTQAALLHSFCNDFLRALPDFFRVMLHPARLGKDLLMFFLRDSNNFS